LTLKNSGERLISSAYTASKISRQAQKGSTTIGVTVSNVGKIIMPRPSNPDGGINRYPLTVNLPKNWIDAISEIGKQRGITADHVIQEAIGGYLDGFPLTPAQVAEAATVRANLARLPLTQVRYEQ
jgi:hypothetical protein